MLAKHALAGCALVLAVSGCAHAGRTSCFGKAADARSVEQSVRSYFAALAAEDETASARLTSPSFYSFDAGKRFTNAELVVAIKRAHAQGTVLQWNIGPVDTHVGCDTAWAAWVNTGAAGPAGALKPVRWLESAMLRRTDGGWKLEFLHSSRAQD